MIRRSTTQKYTCRRCFATYAAKNVPVTLAYKLHQPPEASNNSPLIIMHGLFGSKSNWQSLSKGFARDLKRNVFVLDARNHGDSPHTADHNYSVMAEDVRRFIHDHGLNQPIVIGHSMGAKTAMTLALKYPDLIKFLIPVDNAPVDVALLSEFPSYVRAMREIEAAKVQKQSDADQILQKTEQDVAIRQFLLTNLIRDDTSRALRFRVNLDTLTRSLGELGDFGLLPEDYQFKKPTLFIRGKYSKYILDEMLPLIGRFFPRFQIKDIDAGHWVQAEKPAEFRDILSTFILDEEENMSEQYRASYKSSQPQVRSFSTTARQQYQHDPKSLTDQEYYQLADDTLNHILHDLEEQADINPDIDVEYSDGVMNVTVSSGTYVINRQPPSKQIWLSSPLSGPKRFDFVDGTGWVYKDGTQLRELLVAEWSDLGIDVAFEQLGLTST